MTPLSGRSAVGSVSLVTTRARARASKSAPVRKAATTPRLSAAPVQVVMAKAQAPAIPNRPPSQRRSVSGTPSHGGYVTTRETNELLIGSAKHKTYSNLKLNVSIVAAGLRYFNALISKAEWKLEPADDSTEAQRIADACDYAIRHMESTWADVTERTSAFAWDGNSVHELVAKRITGGDWDGLIALENAYPVAPHTITRWVMGAKGLDGIHQRNVSGGPEIPLPRRGLLYLVDNAITDSPEGTGLLRHCVEPAQRLARLQQLEGRDYETSIAGMPVISAPLSKMADEADADERLATQHAATRAALEGFIDNHLKAADRGLLLESEPWADATGNLTNVRKMFLEIMRGDASSLVPIASAINRYVHDIARILGMEMLLLGSDGVGSLALGQVKADVLALLISSVLGKLCAAVDRDVIRWLGELNGWPVELLPRARVGSVDFRGPEARAELLKSLAAAGVVFQRSDRLVGEVIREANLTWTDEDANADLADAAGMREDEQDPDEPLDDPEPEEDVEDKPEPEKKPVKKRLYKLE